jgi:peroxiredoxin
VHESEPNISDWAFARIDGKGPNPVSRRASIIKRAAFMAVVTVLAASAGSAGVLLWRNFNPPPEPVARVPAVSLTNDGKQASSLSIGDRRPDFSLPDVDGVEHSVAQWDGQLLLINFWATWCPPCLAEIPIFVRLQAEFAAQGVQFLGVALDNVDNVRAFQTEHAMNYPSMHGQRDAISLSKRYGNSIGALPYTVVVARDGSVVTMHHGEMAEADVRQLIEANR